MKKAQPLKLQKKNKQTHKKTKIAPFLGHALNRTRFSALLDAVASAQGPNQGLFLFFYD
jgi:hypothetical protein